MKQQHTLQPKWRFPEFEGNWALKKYKEIIIENRLGGNYDNFDEISDFPLIKMGNIGRGNIILSKIQYLKGEENINNDDILKKGDLLFNTRNTLELVGKVAIWNNELDFALYNSNLMRMTFDNNIIESSNLFMNSLFNQLKTIKQLRSIATGTTSVAAIYNKDLNSISFFIPSLPEQQKIADYLSTIDTKINLLEEKKAQLALYKKAMMQKLFSQEIRFKPTQCHTEPVEVEPVEVELMETYPDWEEKRLGEVFLGLKGQGLSKDSLLDEGEHNCILYGELFTKYKEVIKSVISKTNTLSGVKSKIGDILIPASTTTNAFDLANATALLLDNVILGGDINILRPKHKLSSEFYAYYLSNFKKYEFGKLGQGITIVHLYYSHFKNILIDIPSLPEQQKIADFLSAIDESIEKVTEQISQTQSFKKAMLQQMFV